MSYREIANELFDESIKQVKKVGERPVVVATLYEYLNKKMPEMYLQEIVTSTEVTEAFVSDYFEIEDDYFGRRYLFLEKRDDGSYLNRQQLFWKVFTYDDIQVHFFTLPIMGDAFLMAESEEVILEVQKKIQEHFRRPDPALTVYTEGGFQASKYYDDMVLTVDWKDIILPDEVKDDVYRIISGFPKAKERYNSLGSVWKRGIMLLGPPGTGKTMICKASSALARDVKMKVLYVKDLVSSGHPDGTIKEIFKKAREMKPCLLLFEDVEGIVGGTSRSVFLNELDGFNSNDGVIVLATTNYPERLDPAILKRPARFDRIYEISVPDRGMRYEFVKYMVETFGYDKYFGMSTPEFYELIANKSHNLSIPYIKESMVSAALKVEEGDEVDFVEEVEESLKSMRKLVKEMDNASEFTDYGTKEKIGAGFSGNNSA